MSLLENKTVLVVGLGLIGGSVARGLRKLHPRMTLLAADRDSRQLQLALEQGVVDAIATSPSELAPRADLVVIAVPTLSVAGVLSQLVSALPVSAVITDVASVKHSVVEAARQILGESALRFVPGHPIAGSEQSGFQAASDDLFRNRKVILTPVDDTAPEAIREVNALWRSLGAQVLGMTVSRHDEVLAATSHLPHLLSYALVEVLVRNQQSEDIFRYAAGGFADFSRLASSDPIMWADIFSANAKATTAILDAYIARLQELRGAVIRADHEQLRESFRLAKSTRDRVMNKLTNPNLAEPPANGSLDLIAGPGGKMSGSLRVPGDKSISHRAVIFGALAEGVTRIDGFLEGEDSLNTLAAFREMGVTATGPDAGRLVIYGVGMRGLQAPGKPLDMGNSGTAMRLLAGLLSAQNFDSELTGDESLSRRPMKRIIDPLRRMGARIDSTPAGTPPLRIKGTGLQAIDYELPVASAQVKSAILLAAMYAEGKTRVRQPVVCRDHTERMLAGFGYSPGVDATEQEICLSGGGSLRAAHIVIPGDISSAAFFLVAAAITPQSSLRLNQVGINPTRTGILDLLGLMGADIRLENQREAGGEPVADLIISHTPLRGIDIPEALIPLAIDEFPALFIAAACAEGVTRLRGAEELRVKESDRLQAMADGLVALGIECTLFPDGIDIRGGKLLGGTVNSEGDHRIAMAFAMASLRSEGPITIRNCANIATSFPGFTELAAEAGVNLKPVTPQAE